MTEWWLVVTVSCERVVTELLRYMQQLYIEQLYNQH